MAWNSFAYDHPHYLERSFLDGPTTIGTGGVAGGHHVSAFAENLWNAHYRIETAGTGTTAAIRLINITSGLSTSTIATTTVGTAVAGSTFSFNSKTAGVTPTSLAAGSVTYGVTVNDLTVVGRVVWEVGVPANTAVTAGI
jgi:hypothetical protein